jgi:hypothetical protein
LGSSLTLFQQVNSPGPGLELWRTGRLKSPGIRPRRLRGRRSRCSTPLRRYQPGSSNPFTDCLLIERRDHQILLLFFGGAQSMAWDFHSASCRAPPKNKKGKGGLVLQAINSQPRWGSRRTKEFGCGDGGREGLGDGEPRIRTLRKLNVSAPISNSIESVAC